MIEFKLKNNILTVISKNVSFFEIKTSYVFIDIINWYKSGKTGKIDDVDMVYKMDDEDITWCKKYYLPKIINKTGE
jgi:hypothetical protein